MFVCMTVLRDPLAQTPGMGISIRKVDHSIMGTKEQAEDLERSNLAKASLTPVSQLSLTCCCGTG